MNLEKKHVEKKVKRGDSNITIEWDFSNIDLDFAKKEDGTLAIYGCGCTGFINDGKKIKGTYNFAVDSDVEKTFTVFLDDGEPLEVKNDKGVSVRNVHGKKYVSVGFTLKVEK